jgi:hypothetical protein
MQGDRWTNLRVGNNWDASRTNVSLVDPSSHVGDVGEGEALASDSMQMPLLATPSDSKSLGLRAVGSYPSGASPYGVMDMAGNASEWVADWYNWSDYSEMPARNPVGTKPPWNHCLRGSSWFSSGGEVGLGSKHEPLFGA